MQLSILFAGNLLNGVILGSVYGLMTMGLSLIFGVLRIVNVGHGAFMMTGAYVALPSGCFGFWGSRRWRLFLSPSRLE
jgi:branched-subunit amino acid ABC-type transport system permease component